MANTTQRSWDNYEGNTPNRSWVGSDLYGKSSRYRPGGSDLDRFGGGNRTQRSWDNYVGKDEESGEPKPPRKSIKDVFEDLQSEESEYDKLQKNPLSKRMREEQRKNAMERAMSEVQKGKMVDDNFDEDFYVS